MSFHNSAKLVYLMEAILGVSSLSIIAVTGGTWFAIVVAGLNCLSMVSELVFFYKFSKEFKKEQQKAEAERQERLKYY